MSNNFATEMPKVTKAMQELPGDMQKAAKVALTKYGNWFETHFVKKQLRARPGLIRRTGTLARGFRSNVIQQEGKITLIFWTGTKYAPIHEFGGTIRPKKAKWLCIPSDILKTPAGVSKVQSPRQIPNLRFVNLGAGRAMMGKREGGVWTTYFNLRKSVRIDPRLKLRETWAEKSPLAVPIIEKEAENVLAGKYQKV